MPISPNSLIYLASASPRRSALLAQMGVMHAVQPVDIDESALTGEAPAAYVTRLASRKAETLWARLPEGGRLPVLGSDTTVALDNAILGKPVDRADGLAMLRKLSGASHQVYTAVALRSSAGLQSRLSVSTVTFRRLSETELETYWKTGEPLDKAGAYAIQGRAAVFIQRIDGSYSGIMGLPIFETAELLQGLGWNPLDAHQEEMHSRHASIGAAR